MTPRPPDDGEPYDVDDLIADERRQSRFTLVIFVLAVLFVGGRGLWPGDANDAVLSEPSSVTSSSTGDR